MNNQQLGLAFDITSKLQTARDNKHTPGHIFEKGTCFCKACHVPLTFLEVNQGVIGIGGLSGSQCNG